MRAASLAVELVVVDEHGESVDIATLFEAFGVSVPAKIYTKGGIRELMSAISPF